MRVPAILLLTAFVLPVQADGHRGGDLERKLDEILRRLERLERRADRRGPDAPRRPDAPRKLHAPGGPHAPQKLHAPRAHDRRDVDLGDFPRLLKAAKRGDKQARKVLQRMRGAIDGAIGTPHKQRKARELRVAFDKEGARRAEMERQKMLAKRRFEDLQRLLNSKKQKQLEARRRMAKLEAEARRLDEEIRRMQEELRAGSK